MHRREDRLEFFAQRGQGVLDLGRNLLVDMPMEHLAVLQLSKLAGQGAGGDAAEEASQFAESPRAIQKVMDHQHFPPAADRRDGRLDRATDGLSVILSRA